MAAAPNITVKMLRVGMLAAFTNSNTTRSLVTEARGSMDVMDSRGKLDVGKPRKPMTSAVIFFSGESPLNKLGVNVHI